MMLRKILLVDDEPMVAKSVSRYLQTLGCDVTTCLNGNDAVVAADSGGFDAAVVDFDLPGLSGEALINKLAELKAGMPIVVISGSTDLKAENYSSFPNGIRFLSKPFDLDELLPLVCLQ